MQYKLKPNVEIGATIKEKITGELCTMTYTWHVQEILQNGVLCTKLSGGSRRFFSLADLWVKRLAIPLFKDPSSEKEQKKIKAECRRCGNCELFVCLKTSAKGHRTGCCSTRKTTHESRDACKNFRRTA